MPILAVLCSLAAASPVSARFALTPQDVCPDDADPCVIDQPLQMRADLPLDFGTRTVRVTGEGRIAGTVKVSCGDFEVDVDGRWLEIEGGGGTSEIFARSRCQSHPASFCRSDRDCEGFGGACAAGTGRIDILRGKVAGVGRDLRLYSRGDVTIAGGVQLGGDLHQPHGGIFYVESGGDLALDAPINVSGFFEWWADSVGAGGTVDVSARGDLHVRRPIRAAGGEALLTFRATGSVDVRASIIASGPGSNSVGHGSTRNGGYLAIFAEEDVRLLPREDGGGIRIDVTGSRFQAEGTTFVGDGGPIDIAADRDIVVGSGVYLRGNSGYGFNDFEFFARGSEMTLEAGERLLFDGRLSARGRGLFGASRTVTLFANDLVRIGESASISTSAFHGSAMTIGALRPAGRVEMDGLLELDGMTRGEADDRLGTGGELEISAGEVSVAGTIRNGGGLEGGRLDFDACRMELASSAIIDANLHPQEDIPATVRFVTGSFLSQAGSVVIAQPTSTVELTYRDALDLLGSFSPAPEVAIVADVPGCPICGDGSQDDGEECDDGNGLSGDGCDVLCRIEANP